MATTRDLEDGTGRPGRAIAREKDDGRGDVLGRAGPAEWRHREHHVGVLRPVLWVALPEHLVQDQAGAIALTRMRRLFGRRDPKRDRPERDARADRGLAALTVLSLA